jgi:hypothetical protein
LTFDVLILLNFYTFDVLFLTFDEVIFNVLTLSPLLTAIFKLTPNVFKTRKIKMKLNYFYHKY